MGFSPPVFENTLEPFPPIPRIQYSGRLMNDAANRTDDELLRRMASGCEESFVTLYRNNSPGVYRFALRMCGSAEIADEVTQEVFLFLLRSPSSFDPRKGQFAAWLLGVARNCALRVIERDSRYIAVEDAQNVTRPHAP